MSGFGQAAPRMGAAWLAAGFALAALGAAYQFKHTKPGG